VYPKFIIYHPTLIGATRRAFSFVIYQSTACILECTQNVLYIIQRRSEQLDMLILLLYINQLPVYWSVPKMYYISSNSDRSNSLFSFVIYQSTACILVERTQNLLCIIQHRSERQALFFCYISINRILEWSVPKTYYVSSNADRSDSRFSFVIYQSTAYWSGVYPKFIMYHPSPIGATRAFRLLYHSTACNSGVYPKFTTQTPPVQIVHGSTAFFASNPIKK
jgi:hypothetical protein